MCHYILYYLFLLVCQAYILIEYLRSFIASYCYMQSVKLVYRRIIYFFHTNTRTTVNGLKI